MVVATVPKNSERAGLCAGGAEDLQPPFADYPQKPGQTIAQYVFNVIKVATCGTKTCNAMFKAQMLATALNVYFSDPSPGANKIGALRPVASSTPVMRTCILCQ